jgi:dihydrofolate reductase
MSLVPSPLRGRVRERVKGWDDSDLPSALHSLWLPNLDSVGIEGGEMSKVVLYIAASLDGYIARPDGDVSWLDPYNDVDYGYDRFFEGIGAIIMGSKSYEALREWYYGKTKTFVVTRRTLPVPQGADVELYSGPFPQLVDKARQVAGGKDVWHFGGGELATAFLNEGLIDEVQLGLIPTLLGEGIPLFHGVAKQASFHLVQSVPFSNGLVILHYSVIKGGQG